MLASNTQILLLSVVLGFYFSICKKQSQELPVDQNYVASVESKVSEKLLKYYENAEFINVFNRKVFVKEVNTENRQKCTVFIHGFPSSSADFSQIFEDILTENDGYALTFDFVGFGFSDKPKTGYFYGIHEHTDTLVEVLNQKLDGRKECSFVSHDMGDTVLTELLARRHRNQLPGWFQTSAPKLSSTKPLIKNVVFTNGGMYYKHIDKRITQILLASSIGYVFDNLLRKLPHSFTMKIQEKQLSSIFSKKSKEDVSTKSFISDLAYLNKQFIDGSGATGSDLIQYLNDRAAYEYRWHDALSEIDIPCKLVWGDHDAVAPVEIAEGIVKVSKGKCEVSYLEGVGHFWMIEKSWKDIKHFFHNK